MEYGDSLNLQDNELLALAHRLAAMRMIRKVTIAIAIVLLLLAIYLWNWLLIPVALVAVWLAAVAISIWSANKVQRLTGLSHHDQRMLWDRYKSDPAIAAKVDRLLHVLDLFGATK